MFAEVLHEKAQTLLRKIAPAVDRQGFYLAGGTGLALQIGHRVSEDLDFFKGTSFQTNSLFSLLKGKTDSAVRVLEEQDTLWISLNGIRCCFFTYDVALLFKPVLFEGLNVADWRDILAEKFKTLSQRGSKKDFVDIFSTLRVKGIGIGEAVSLCKKRFESTGLNFYHVLRSLTYFEDAEVDPDPLLVKTDAFPWEEVRSFFVDHIKEFEKHFIG